MALYAYVCIPNWNDLAVSFIDYQGVWYYGSDVSMFFILLYVWSTRYVVDITNVLSFECTHILGHHRYQLLMSMKKKLRHRKKSVIH